MKEEFIRSALLLGEEAMDYLSKKRIAVFGIGGVGGYAAEALCRTGVGKFVLVDDDVVSVSNLNRQIIATRSTIGRAKVEVMKERILDINPDCEVEIVQDVYMPDNKERFDFASYDYVVDAIDTVTGKISLAVECCQRAVPIISAMGAGNKLDPAGFEVTTIDKTSVCPLARVMRSELRKRGIHTLKVVHSREIPVVPKNPGEIHLESEDREFAPTHTKRQTPGSLAFVPSVAGMILAGEVIKDLIRSWNEENGA